MTEQPSPAHPEKPGTERHLSLLSRDAPEITTPKLTPLATWHRMTPEQRKAHRAKRAAEKLAHREQVKARQEARERRMLLRAMEEAREQSRREAARKGLPEPRYLLDARPVRLNKSCYFDFGNSGGFSMEYRRPPDAAPMDDAPEWVRRKWKTFRETGKADGGLRFWARMTWPTAEIEWGTHR